MGREPDLDSVRAVEKQVEGREMAIVKPKRSNNSLLNVSVFIPPEVLGEIFHWNVILERGHMGTRAASYNFLLVCHHWFEVASHTPELWSSWGTRLWQWRRRYTCSRTVRLDLELTNDFKLGCRVLDEPIRHALQDHAARDAIRRVVLITGCSDLQNSIILSITPRGEGSRSSSLESFVSHPWDDSGTVELSDFFARHHFLKLRHLELLGPRNISSWDSLASQTGVLTTLTLMINGCSTPTTSQLLSILSSNPNLQRLQLSGDVIPTSNNDISAFQVRLNQLEYLQLSGDPHGILSLLDRLVLSDKIVSLKLDLLDCPVREILQSLGRYLGNYLRCHNRSREGLAVFASPDRDPFMLTVGEPSEIRGLAWFVRVSMRKPLDEQPSEEECEEACFGVLACVPLGRVISYNAPFSPLKSEDLCVQMSNLFTLEAWRPNLFTWFAEPNPRRTQANEDLFPSLKCLILQFPVLSEDGLSPLTTFLSRRASVGKRIHSLTLVGCPNIRPDVAQDIRGMVTHFDHLKIYWSGPPSMRALDA